MEMLQMTKAGSANLIKKEPGLPGLELMQIILLTVFGLLVAGLGMSLAVICASGSFVSCISQVMFGSV